MSKKDTCGGPRGPYLGRYDPYMTLADAQRGYSETKKHLRGMDSDSLKREYLEMSRASFNRMFGHNARKAANLVAEELLARQCTEIDNMFGPIPVRELSGLRRRRR